MFRGAIWESALANPLPSSSELFAVYDTCLRRVADRFAPEHTACSNVRPLSPWFDADCRAIRRNCRRLERRYRRTMSTEDRMEWIKAVRQKHVDFLEKKNNYWSTRLSSESRTPSKLWKSMAKILRRDTNQGTPPPSVLTADGFLKFFSDKVESFRGATMGQPLPRILPTAVTSLSHFQACTEDEVREVIMRSPPKSCSLDPIPTTILKECIDDLSSTTVRAEGSLDPYLHLFDPYLHLFDPYMTPYTKALHTGMSIIFNYVIYLIIIFSFREDIADLPASRVATICDRISPYRPNFNFPSLSRPSIASGRITAHFMAIYYNDGSGLLSLLDDA